MLEHLFGSRTRVKLLSLFLNNPQEPLFVRELTRRISTQINAVRRELSNLVKFGLVREVKGNSEDSKRPGLRRRYYQLNKVYPLLPEIKALITKAQVLVEHRMDRQLESIGHVKYAALMGSFLGLPNAPVDLFIVGTVHGATLRKLLSKLEQALGHEVNYTVLTLQEYLYRREMSDKFLTSILDAPKNVIVDRLAEMGRR